MSSSPLAVRGYRSELIDRNGRLVVRIDERVVESGENESDPASSGPSQRTALGYGVGSSSLQVAGGSLAALGNELVADTLTFSERRHAGAFDRALVDEHVLRAVLGLYETKTSRGVEKLHSSYSHLWPP
jgi:hypothetical protein